MTSGHGDKDASFNEAVNPSRQPAEGGREEIDEQLAIQRERKEREAAKSPQSDTPK